jgi:hypothetical protein
MVKFGGVRNYICATWSQQDLDACADLNLPCADISAMLAEPMDNALRGDNGSLSPHDQLVRLPREFCPPTMAAFFGTAGLLQNSSGLLLLSFNVCLPIVFHRQVVRWLRPTLVAHLLRQGFVTLYSGARDLCAAAGFRCQAAGLSVCSCNKAVTDSMNASPTTLCLLSLPPSSDSDVAYTMKPVWESYLRYTEAIAGVDAAFQHLDGTPLRAWLLCNI